LFGILSYMSNSRLFLLLQRVPVKEYIGKLGNCANSQLFVLRDYRPYREHSNIGIHGNRGVTYVQYCNDMCKIHKVVPLYSVICWLIVIVVHCRCLPETVCQLKCAISVSSKLIHHTISSYSARAQTLRCGSISGVWIRSQIHIR